MEAVSKVDNIFSQYVQKQSVFKDKTVLTSNFIPEKIPHRSEEITQLSLALAPMLKGFHASNVFVYGTCGTGKTICSRFVVNQLEEAAKDGQIKTIYINCKMKKVADTEYRLLAQLLKELGECVPDTGLPTDVLYRRFFENADSKRQTLVLVLDEIDALFKKIGDEFLYNLTRINQELKQAKLNIVGITNDLSFRDGLDMRVRSSLGEEEILFRPYNALQLKHILEERAKTGFETGLDEAILNKCAAIAAQEHGDARRALDLLRVAGELAERQGDAKITEAHIDMAEQKIDLDRVIETIKSQPSQSQIVLHAIIKLAESRKKTTKWADARLLTGDVFATYESVCKENGIKSLTQRRVSDLIAELDMLGIITAKVISKGRYGRTKEISMAISNSHLDRVKAFLAGRFSP
ncbi:MAG: orc1/cdc6 family replication initiation protein [Candidatus Aenigmarchaeota archaeon]|nr:orc1/cdc6 family replication initiation protein [Candidatus Aenigmarchaeota archaeon]